MRLLLDALARVARQVALAEEVVQHAARGRRVERLELDLDARARAQRLRGRAAGRVGGLAKPGPTEVDEEDRVLLAEPEQRLEELDRRRGPPNADRRSPTTSGRSPLARAQQLGHAAQRSASRSHRRARPARRASAGSSSGTPSSVARNGSTSRRPRRAGGRVRARRACSSACASSSPSSMPISERQQVDDGVEGEMPHRSRPSGLRTRSPLGLADSSRSRASSRDLPRPAAPTMLTIPPCRRASRRRAAASASSSRVAADERREHARARRRRGRGAAAR